MSADPVILGVGAVYLAACAGIGWWATRRTRSAADFYAAGRALGPWTTAIAAMAATLSGFAFIGGPGLVYRLGLGAVYIVLPAGLTATLGAWVLGRRLCRLAASHGVLTIPAAIGVRYGSRTAQGLTAAAMLVAIVGYLATNALALGLVLEATFGLARAPALWIGSAVTLGYSAAGGILAGVWTDVLQGALMALAAALVFLFVLRVGGESGGLLATIAAHDPAWVSPFGRLGAVPALSFFLVFGLGTLGQPHVVHKFLMVRDEAALRWYPAVMTGALLVTLLLFVGVGTAMAALVATGAEPPLARPDDATSRFLLGHVPRWLAALVFSGTAAAIMSTVNAFLSVGAAALARDLPEAFGRRAGAGLAAGRWGTIALALAATAVAQASDAAVALLGVFGWGLFASTLVPALGLGLAWPGASQRGAVASITTGFLATIGLEGATWSGRIVLPPGVTGTSVAMIASLLVFLVVSRATYGSDDADRASELEDVISAS